MNKFALFIERLFFITTKIKRIQLKNYSWDTLIVVDGAKLCFFLFWLVNLNIKHILWEHYTPILGQSSRSHAR